MLSIAAWKPSIIASGTNVIYVPRGTYLGTLTGMGEFNFTLEANGGYWEFSITINESQVDIEDWFSDGVGRHIEIHNDALVIIWEGFVDQVAINLGPLSDTRGPFMNITNRCTAMHALSAIVGNEIVTTQNLSTTTADNDASKLRYGIVEKILSAGTVWDTTEADEIRDTWLNEYALPKTSKRFNNQSQSQPSMTISCLGYIHFLKNYIYNNNTAGADNISVPIYDPTNANSKLRAILEADPNNLFTDDSNWEFDTNMILEPSWEDQNTDAYTIIQTMISKGDGASNRMLFGVYADCRVVYAAAPTVLEYHQALSDPEQAIKTVAGASVYPWNAEAGKWLLFTDFLVGRAIPVTLREDPRAMFIEKVAYSTPWGLALDGGKLDTISQKLARLGIGT